MSTLTAFLTFILLGELFPFEKNKRIQHACVHQMRTSSLPHYKKAVGI